MSDNSCDRLRETKAFKGIARSTDAEESDTRGKRREPNLNITSSGGIQQCIVGFAPSLDVFHCESTTKITAL